MRTPARKPCKVQEMASEYRFDYKKAKPNRFAEKMNLAARWMVEKFVEGEKEKPVKKKASANGRTASAGKKTVAKKAPAKAKKTAPKRTKPAKKKSAPKKASKTTKKKKK